MHRPAAMIRLLTLIAFALFLPACTHTYGLDVINKTEQPIRFQSLTVKPDGSTTQFATGIISPGGAFQEKADDIRQTNGRRVRFTLGDAPPHDAPPSSTLELAIPDSKTRHFDLVVRANRLLALEYKRGRDTGPPETMK